MKNLSEQGYIFLKDREQLKLKAYKDSAGIWTIGWGHTSPNITVNTEWNQQQAEDALHNDVKWAERAINKLVTVPLMQCHFDALTILLFNIGETAFAASTLLKYINERDFERATKEEWPKWNKVHSARNTLVVSRGLTNRRAAEVLLFNAEY